MLANGTLVQDSFFSAEFAAKYADKLVGVPGPVWYTGAIFQGGLAIPAGQIGVAPPLKWEGGDVAAGNVGGGQWYASSHSKNLDAVKTFLEFVTSADEFQVEASSGYPAYTAAAEKWLDKQAEAAYFVNDDFKTVMSDAAGSGLGRLERHQLEPRDRLGEGRHPRHRRGRDRRVAAAGLAEGTRERGHRQRIHGEVT